MSPAMNMSSTILAHHGLVAGMYDELGIGQLIDEALPKVGPHKLPNSTSLKAMVINALGFNERRLYFFPQFFNNLSTERLLGEGIKPEDINDDVLGRTLDQIYAYGSTELFLKIVLRVMNQMSFGTQLLHVDTTSVSVHGYFEHIDGSPAIEITYGHTKDHRPDLKQFVMSTITNQHGIPLFVKAHSGNADDKKTLISSIQALRSAVQIPDNVYVIADAALYTAHNIARLSKDVHWITRVPATNTEAVELLTREVVLTPRIDPKYSFFETISHFGEIPQKWVLVWSKENQARKEKTFGKTLDKMDKKTRKSLKKLCSVEFACETDAQKAIDHWVKNHPWYQISQYVVTSRSRRMNGKRGRPKSDEPMMTVYQIRADIVRNEAVIKVERERLGRFILASNDLSLDAETILAYYKNQGAVERGFRFLKDRSFRISEVYLKKPERIEALSMVMVLTLLIYSLLEWKIRNKLKEQNEFVLNQVKKPVQNPTMKWIFMDFVGVVDMTVQIGDEEYRQIANLNENAVKIIGLLGKSCEKYYV